MVLAACLCEVLFCFVFLGSGFGAGAMIGGGVVYYGFNCTVIACALSWSLYVLCFGCLALTMMFDLCIRLL